MPLLLLGVWSLKLDQAASICQWLEDGWTSERWHTVGICFAGQPLPSYGINCAQTAGVAEYI